MPTQPLVITLSDGQKIEALKRFRAKYQEEMEKITAELGELLIQLAEADFLTSYLGEQPEIVELRTRKTEADKLERRRQHLGMIIERLDQVIPKQAEVKVPLPNGNPVGAQRGNVRRY